MIDFILIIFTIVCFAGGFWCGKTYGSVGAMLKRIKAKVVGWMS